MYTDEWERLNSVIEVERSPSNRREFTNKLYEDFRRNSKSFVCAWNSVKNQTEQNCDQLKVDFS